MAVEDVGVVASIEPQLARAVGAVRKRRLRVPIVLPLFGDVPGVVERSE
jgi:hypothetical protein